MDSPYQEEVLHTCENLATFYINSILELKAPELSNDFPEFPKDAPKELLFVPPKKLKATSSTESRKSRVKDEKIIKVSKFEKLEEMELTKPGSKRRCRYSGTYNVEKQLSNILESRQSESEEEVQVKKEHPENGAEKDENKSEFFNALGIQKSLPKLPPETSGSISSDFTLKLRNFQTFVVKNDANNEKSKARMKTLSDSSSDEEENSNESNELDLSRVRFPLCKIERCDSSKKLPDKPQTSNEIVKNRQIPKQVIENPRKVQNSKVLKSIFQNSPSFDDAMETYSKKKKELQKVVRPKIIPPPKIDPSLKKKKKPLKPNGVKNNGSHPNKHLGGIFTINNGWDKEENKIIEEQAEKKKENLSKVERHITPPNIVIDTNLNDDVMAAHDEFMYNEDYMDNVLTPQNSSSSMSSTSSNNLNIAHSSDCLTENDNISKRMKNIKSSVNSSDVDDSENDEEITKPSKKVQRLSYSDDDDEEEESPSENFKRARHNDDGVISLHAEVGEFDDLDDEKDQLCSEVDPDDLKIKFQCVNRKVEPLDHQTEFDLNTKEISQHMVDPETDKVLKTIFGNVCPAFLEKRCSMPACQRNHYLPEEAQIRPLLINAAFDVLKSVFQVALKFHRLFQTYISIFVEVCIRNKDELGLMELVKSCDRFPRTIVCYRDIVRKLVELDYMKEHRAISFIIAHHTDSQIARDTILSLILDSGPCIAFFMDYIEKIHIKQPIRSDMFSKILHTCVAYQNPKLPNFCLNYLQGCSPNQMKNLNSAHLMAFLKLNKCLSELNEHREGKALIISEKLANI